MTAVAEEATRRRTGLGSGLGPGRENGRGSWLETLALALLAYVPFLLSSPGRLSADTKAYLFLDPGRFLARTPYLWDPSVGFGTVTHQGIGYLFPMGPFFWLSDAVGLPDWVAQRLWLGSISFAAVLGARWLFRMLGASRVAALGGALVYMLTPYQLSFTAGLSVLLLPWAGLPWLLGLTMRATRRGGWRDPALFALVLLTISSVNASSVLLVLIAPGLWLVMEALRGSAAARAAVGAAAKIALLGIGVSIWWAAGLRTQGAYGLPVLQLTETVRTVAEASNPADILRATGNWLLTSRSRLGSVIDQGPSYFKDQLVIVASFAIPVLAIAASGLLRWRHRAYFVVLLVVGTVVGVGAWPYDDPSPYGSMFKTLANDFSAVFAFRNTPRVVPIIVLALAGLLAAAVTALGEHRRQIAGASIVGGLAVVALLPVWQMGYLSDALDRPEHLPRYWDEAAAALDRGAHSTRILELPGQPFYAFRWGNAVEPILPGLTDRPYATRVVLPVGSPQSVDMIDALDRRLQEGTFEPNALAAWARLTGVGTIVQRSDTEYERYDSPIPRLLWRDFTDPIPPGIAAPTTFGDAKPNRAGSPLPMIDGVELRTPRDAEDPPPVALFDVIDPVPIIHAAPSDQPVLVAGSAEGIVDVAAAGLIDGDQLVLESASLSGAELRRALDAGADIVITDSNRRRSHDYFSRLRDVDGYTQRADQTKDRRDDAFALDPFPGSDAEGQTVVEQVGATVDATAYAVSADRPANAFDGDTRTAWRVNRRPVGEEIRVRPDTPVRTDHVTLAQLPVAPIDRHIASVRLHFDDDETLDVDLTDASLASGGQVVTFPEREVSELAVEITKLAYPRAQPKEVGFTEIGLGDVRVREIVRLPVDVSERAAAAAQGHRLDVVLSRLRYEPARIQDEELALDRRVVVPDSRAYELSGTARVNPNAADPVLDTVLGTVAPGTEFTSSDHLLGDADARASRAFDGDPTTAWTPNPGPQRGRWVDVALPGPTTVDHIDLTYATDANHAVPTQFTLAVDGAPQRTFTVGPPTDGVSRSGLESVTVPFDPVTGRQFSLFVDAVTPNTTRFALGQPKVQLPVSIAEVGLSGAPRPAPPSAIDSGCRDDLVVVDDAPVPVRVVGAARAARTGLALEECGASVALAQGSNSVVTSKGLDTGYDLDRIVLSSGAAGTPTPATVLGAPLDTSGATTRVISSSSGSHEVRVKTDGRPFWLVLGESYSEGWEAEASSGRVGDLQLVNGFANGWLVTPSRAGTIEIDLNWTPQRVVWVGLAISIVAVIACIAIVAVVTGRRRRRGLADGDAPDAAADDELHDSPELASPFTYDGDRLGAGAVAAVAIGSGVIAALFSRPWVGLVVAIATLLAAVLARGRILLVAGAPLALALAPIVDVPELAWLALGLLVANLVVGGVGHWLGRRRGQGDAGPVVGPQSGQEPVIRQ